MWTSGGRDVEQTGPETQLPRGFLGDALDLPDTTLCGRVGVVVEDELADRLLKVVVPRNGDGAELSGLLNDGGHGGPSRYGDERRGKER